MKGVVPENSCYVPLTQQKCCCVPTCVQMVMLRHRIPLRSAELIGYHMGLVVSKTATKYFWNVRTGPRPPAGYGTQASKTKFSPNAAFKKLKIPLKTTWSLINKFKNLDQFRDYLAKVETTNIDVLVCYDWPSLWNPRKTEHWGHVCVLDKVFIKKDRVRIIDPDWEAPKWREVKIPALYKAMVFHGPKNSGGFWELKKI